MKTKSAFLAGLPPLLVALAACHAPAAVVIHGAASSSGPQITVQVYADVTTTPVLSHGARVLFDPLTLQVVDATRNEAVWYFRDRVNPIPYVSPDVSRPGEVLLLGGQLKTAAPLDGVLGNDLLLGTVVFGRNTPDTPKFELTRGRAAPFANFVTKYGAILADVSGEVVFAGVTPDPTDEDLDGLLDDWEKKYFGGIENAFYLDDRDRDGYTHLQEQNLGSDPTREDSTLQFTIAIMPPQVVLRWTSFENRTYTIEVSENLGTFKPLKTGIKATPPLNTFTLVPPSQPGAAFYRVALEGTAPR